MLTIQNLFLSLQRQTKTKLKMIYSLLIICIILLAIIYYASIVMQSLFPRVFKITDKEITFIKAAIPFYYWICGNKKTNSHNNKQQKQQENG